MLYLLGADLFAVDKDEKRAIDYAVKTEDREFLKEAMDYEQNMTSADALEMAKKKMKKVLEW